MGYNIGLELSKIKECKNIDEIKDFLALHNFNLVHYSDCSNSTLEGFVDGIDAECWDDTDIYIRLIVNLNPNLKISAYKSYT